MWKNAISSVCLMMMLPSFAWATGGPQLVQNGATELDTNQPGDPALHHGIEFTEGIEHEVDLTGLTTGEALTVQGLTDHELDHPHLIRPMSGSSTGITSRAASSTKTTATRGSSTAGTTPWETKA